jgi:CspA family cold shock protein
LRLDAIRVITVPDLRIHFNVFSPPSAAANHFSDGYLYVWQHVPVCRVWPGTLGERNYVVSERGVVKWFNGAKGYGFIQRSTGEDVFVHFSAIQEKGFRTLNEGESVDFECQQGPKGLNALNVIRNQ